MDELVIERILAIARYLHQLNQHLYTRSRYDRETLVALESQLEAARNDVRQLRASAQERQDVIPDEDYAEQLREVIGELQDASSDLRIERSRTTRLVLDLEASRRQAHDLAQDLTREKEQSAGARSDLDACRLAKLLVEDTLRLTTVERDSLTEQLRQVRETSIEAEQAHLREQEQMRNDLELARNDALQLRATEQELDRLRRELASRGHTRR